eukprot:591766_1
MSLKQAVTFRHLSCQLSQEETRSFLLKLMNDTPEFLISSIFNHLQFASIALGLDINNKISNIISSRSSPFLKPTQATLNTIPTHATLDTIPTPLISKIASYLEQMEYSNLSKVNRDTFIGCHSPNSLQEIDFDINLHYDGDFESATNANHFPFNYDLYSSAKHLYFDLNQYRYRLQQIATPFLDQLQSICFSGTRNPDMFCIDAFKDFPVSKNIETLYIECWGKHMEVSDSQFQHFLSKFPNVQYLQLSSVDNVDFAFIKSLFPTLKGLSVEGLGFYRNPRKYKQLIYHFGEQLEFLSIDGIPEVHPHHFNKIKFNKLEELKLQWTDTRDMNAIIQTAKTLQKLYLSRRKSEQTVRLIHQIKKRSITRHIQVQN